MSDQDDLLAQAKAIQAKKMAQTDDGSNPLLSQARAIQQQKLSQITPPQSSESSMLSKGLDFAKNLPESAIDLVPGMKEKRENIANFKTTPTYQNAPSDVPNVPQGQRDQAFKQSADSAINDPAMGLIGATSESSLLDLAKMVPGLGSKLTSMAPKLETAGSKMAQEAMGMNSAKDLTSEFNPMSGKVERGSDIIKGTGTTALDQGVLEGGTGQWYDNALTALKENSNKLSPLLKDAQSKLDPNMEQIVNQVGPIATKTSKVMQDIFDGVPQSSQKNLIVKKLGTQYSQYEQKLAAADGNLEALNQVKRELQTAAQNLSPQIYNNGTAKAEADLYKRLGGVVRQHIEDLASAADPGMGDQIHQVNKTIGNLSSMVPALQKTTRGGLPTNMKDLGQALTGPVEGFVAKGLNTASKVVQTPIGEIAQKTIPAVAKTAVNNPWDSIKNNTSETPAQNSTKIAGFLYNATSDSLKNVASKLSKAPGMEHVAKSLEKSIMDNDIDAKNRAIFVIMQNPSSRKLVTPGESDER